MRRTWLILCSMLVATNAFAALPDRLVCYDDLFTPYFMLQDGRYTGVYKDVLSEAAGRAGIVIEFRHMPWRRIESELERHGIDCAFALSRTARREQYLDYGKVPLHPTEYVLFVRDEAGAAAGLEDLQGKTIGVRAGVRLPVEITAGVRAGRFKVSEINSDAVNFQKLKLRRVDAVLTDAFVGMYTLRQLNLPGVRQLSPSLMSFDTFVVFPKSMQSARLAAAFDRAFEDMRHDGSYERLTASYLNGLARKP